MLCNVVATERRIEILDERTKLIQCKYCIQVLRSEFRYARHIGTKHPEKIEEYIKGE